MDRSKSLAQMMAKQTQFSETEWFKVFESAAQSLVFMQLSDDVFEKLAHACNSPTQFMLLTRLFYEFGRTEMQKGQAFQLLVHHVDQSIFNLSEWVAALEQFQLWLDSKQRKSHLRSMLEYLSCVAESPDCRQGGCQFLPVLHDMLHTYGFEEEKYFPEKKKA